MARNLSFFVSSSMGMRKTYRNPSKVIARLPQGEVQDGNGKKPKPFRQFIDGNEKNIQESQQGDSSPALGGWVQDGNGKKHYFFVNSSMGMKKNIQESQQGDSSPALGGSVGWQWQETLCFSLVHGLGCPKHIGILAMGQPACPRGVCGTIMARNFRLFDSSSMGM